MDISGSLAHPDPRLEDWNVYTIIAYAPEYAELHIKSPSGVAREDVRKQVLAPISAALEALLATRMEYRKNQCDLW
jgi:hypothetical protein